MTLLLINYAIFSNPILLIIGYAIAGLEAVTAVLQFIKVVFRNNEKLVKKIDSKIIKYEKAINTLRERQAYYSAELAYQNAHAAQKIPEHIEIKRDDNDAAELAEIDKENAAELAEHEKADFDADFGTVDDGYNEDPAEQADEDANNNESYELFKKFVAQVKKND